MCPRNSFKWLFIAISDIMPTPLLPSWKVHGINGFYKVVLMGQFYQKCNCWHVIHFKLKQMVMDGLTLIPIQTHGLLGINRLFLTKNIDMNVFFNNIIQMTMIFKQRVFLTKKLLVWFILHSVCLELFFVSAICLCYVVVTLLFYRWTFNELNNCLSVIWIVV